MRYAILSDLHANLQALQRVLDDAARQQIDQFVLCGDIVGYGAQPNECCAAVRGLSALIVRGNHDEAAVFPAKEEWFNPSALACIQWTRAQLTADHLEFLRGLSPTGRVPGAHVCHGSLPEPDLYTTGPTQAMLTCDAMEEPLCFLGHTHCAEWYTYRNDNHAPTHSPRTSGGRLEVAPGRKYVINPGAVGQPRDGNSQASYAVWDQDAQAVEIRRVSYDVAEAQRLIHEAGLPASMADRLRYGI